MKTYSITMRPAVVKYLKSYSSGTEFAANLLINSSMTSESLRYLSEAARFGRGYLYKAEFVEIFGDDPPGTEPLTVEYTAPPEIASVIDRMAKALGISADSAASLLFANGFGRGMSYAISKTTGHTLN